MGGRYYYGSGNAGQGLMRYDGSQWHRIGVQGGGLQIYNNSDTYSPSVYDMEVRDGLLLVGGAFFYADHLPTWCTASWDGSQWCRIGGAVQDMWHVSQLEFFHDTLYMGCMVGYDILDLKGLARYTGTNYQVQCSTAGVQEAALPHAALRAYAPQPGLVALLGLADGLHRLQVFDAQGRLMLDTEVRSTGGRTAAVALVTQGRALYLLRADGLRTTKYIAQP